MTTTEFPHDFEKTILEEAIDSPPAAMMRLSFEIERQLRLLLAASGQLQQYTGLSPIGALDLLAKSVGEPSFPQSLRGTIESYWKLRNEVVHGGRIRQQLALRAVDYGIRILKMLHAIPRRSYVIVHNAVPVLSDSEGRNLRSDVQGVIIWTMGPKGGVENIHIFPSRKNYFAGQNVSWEWDMQGRGWGESWYRDPITKDIKYAWTECLEFIGRPLDEI